MGVRIAGKKDVPEGGCIAVDTPDGRAVALFNVAGQIYALDNTCPHAGGPLGEGYLEDKTVTCPWHGWSFDVTTGECQNNPDAAAQCLKTTVQGEDVLID
ncbi:MAG: hypothetical protein A3G34_13060 [Candidatus Lindowbacteria bacterium RIFCSPLOWO2_12_FULL_62_27]|nr:MAG: hypothetical protein A3I06_14990 [Candidatus Lindowbacteria bacterium RIFCSPLOWO2_02_FULL_62_12]OGH62514.1 MAG: hypothetical protein A3G34_13060 [Candidatus Lindowbacteria bacterium RIFCSPLOWO2_12_FULL_62_27]